MAICRCGCGLTRYHDPIAINLNSTALLVRYPPEYVLNTNRTLLAVRSTYSTE